MYYGRDHRSEQYRDHKHRYEAQSRRKRRQEKTDHIDRQSEDVRDARQASAPIAGKKNRYIDAQKFTALFAKNGRNKNRRLIAAGIYLIAHHFVMRYASMPATWRQDAASEAALLGIRKIWHYQQNCRKENAFSYFTKLIQNKVRERLRMELWRQKGLSPWGWQTEMRRAKRQKKRTMNDER